MFYMVGENGKIPQGYKKIRTYLIYSVKHDGRHKARMVDDGHLTEILVESVYSGVVSLRGPRMFMFLVEINDLDACATDICNAYLNLVRSTFTYLLCRGKIQGFTLLKKERLYRV